MGTQKNRLIVEEKENILLTKHAQILEFSSGEVQVSLTKISSDNVFSPQLILQKSNGQFQGSSGGPTFSREGGGGGGSNCLFAIVTHITCDFPGGGGGVRTPCPPFLDTHLLKACNIIWQTQQLSESSTTSRLHLNKLPFANALYRVILYRGLTSKVTLLFSIRCDLRSWHKHSCSVSAYSKLASEFIWP